MKCNCCNYEGDFEKIVIRDIDGYNCDTEVRTDFYDGKFKYNIQLYGCPQCGTVKFVKSE